MPPPKLLTGRELAERLDRRYDDVMGWARDGLIPSIKTNGRVYFDFAKVCAALNGLKEEEAAPCA